jgi:hypothetical protein
MFLLNSRYADVKEATVALRGGGTATVVRVRRLAVVAGEPTVVVGNDRLDVMAERRYSDATKFWHVADANSELEAGRLVETAARVIEVPNQ